MIATATEPLQRQRPQGLSRPTLLVALSGLLLLLSACSEEALPQRRLSADDCLTDVQLDRLDRALKRCDRVVAAFPNDPQPLNERFLLRSLKGDETAACRDIGKAAQLASRIPPARIDRLLRRDLDLRLASCRERPGAQAGPSSAPPAARPAPTGG